MNKITYAGLGLVLGFFLLGLLPKFVTTLAVGLSVLALIVGLVWGISVLNNKFPDIKECILCVFFIIVLGGFTLLGAYCIGCALGFGDPAVDAWIKGN